MFVYPLLLLLLLLVLFLLHLHLRFAVVVVVVVVADGLPKPGAGALDRGEADHQHWGLPGGPGCTQNDWAWEPAGCQRDSGRYGRLGAVELVG